jgi:hypothetical protein
MSVFSDVEIIFLCFLQENYFVKELIPQSFPAGLASFDWTGTNRPDPFWRIL